MDSKRLRLLRFLVEVKRITKEQYKEITGVDYEQKLTRV